MPAAGCRGRALQALPLLGLALLALIPTASAHDWSSE